MADGMTKNQAEKLFGDHHIILTQGRLPYRREDVSKALESMQSNESVARSSGLPEHSTVTDDSDSSRRHNGNDVESDLNHTSRVDWSATSE